MENLQEFVMFNTQEIVMEKIHLDPGQKVELSKISPTEIPEFSIDRKDAEEKFLQLNSEIEKLQELLYAEHKHQLLVVLQAMDTGGKDGVIRHVFDRVNPQGVRVANFKVPTNIELDHDYLWRIHKQTPAKGEIVIFNRSHYEDVLVVRVHNLVSREVWSKRYTHINSFEKLLHDEGTTILKFYLHIDKDEQRNRLEARLNDPSKQWKFNPGDIKERELWNDYIEAYEDVIEKTNTEYAPWFIIPANRKWYRNLVIASILVDKMKGLKMKFPDPIFAPQEVIIK